jgi:DNA-binding FadR family transcriptional regulator
VAKSDAARARPRKKPQQVADELRARILNGEVSEGDSLGREPDLIEQFGVSRPSLREALRILEAEGLISVVPGMFGGVVVHEPDRRVSARTAALMLQSRNVSLADVYDARGILEPAAVWVIAQSPTRQAAATELRKLIAAQEKVIHDPDAYGQANAVFHERLISLAGNETLTIIAEMLSEVVLRAVTAVSKTGPATESLAIRRRGLRSQKHVADLIDAGEALQAEAHWRSHMAAVGRVMLGQAATTVVDLMNHY